MREVNMAPDCRICGKPIEKPSDTDMEQFRLGIACHNSCADKKLPGFDKSEQSHLIFNKYFGTRRYDKE